MKKKGRYVRILWLSASVLALLMIGAVAFGSTGSGEDCNGRPMCCDSTNSAGGQCYATGAGATCDLFDSGYCAGCYDGMGGEATQCGPNGGAGGGPPAY